MEIIIVFHTFCKKDGENKGDSSFISHTLSGVEILKCEEFSLDGNELITSHVIQC